MNLDPRTIVILTVLSTLLMSGSLFFVARGYLADMRGVNRWAAGTLLQSIGWVLLALMGVIPLVISEFGSPFIMLALALYFHALTEFKDGKTRVIWVYVVVSLNVLAIYYFILVVPNMAARIVVASSTGALLMFASARLLFNTSHGTPPISHKLTGLLFAACSAVLVVRAAYYLFLNTSPTQSGFEQNIVQDVAFLTFFVAAVVSPFSFVLMCNDRYGANSLLRTAELASKNSDLEIASHAKGQFLATMSHELRTPLNGVIGFLSQLGKTDLNAQQKDYLHTIDLSARTLLSVINDVLDFSKIEAGKLSIESISIDLRELIDDAISIFAVSAEEKGLDLVCIVDHAVPKRLLGDPLRLTQIISNLVGNAIKFTEKGEVLVEVSLIKETDQNASLKICVTDTGIGISEQSLTKLFQPFVQADASTTRKHGGTGLGLIIARKLIDMMGGVLAVESKMWEGTRFTITLELPKEKAKMPDAQSESNMSMRRVLIVTPNFNVARGLREHLSGLIGYCHVVENGFSALEQIRESFISALPYDAVLFDASVADMTPIEFSQEMSGDKVLKAIPLLLLGGISCRQQAKDIQNNRFLGCIIKPAKFSSTYNQLHKLFSGSLERGEHLHFKSNSVVNDTSRIMIKPLVGKRILIVDDNHINRKLVQLLVEEMGGVFDLAENGVQAIDAYSRKAFDAILMDVNMPVMDGMEATQRIRALESGSRKTPIIALTANALPGDKERFLAVGMDDYLSKPLSEKSLMIILNRIFAGGAGAAENKEIPLATQEHHAQPALDPNLGIELSFGDHATWKMALGMLLDDLPGFGAMLDEAADDVQQLMHVAHKLVGASCYCGTISLNETAKQLESHCRQNDFSHVKESLHKLILQIERLKGLEAAGKLRTANETVY